MFLTIPSNPQTLITPFTEKIVRDILNIKLNYYIVIFIFTIPVFYYRFEIYLFTDYIGDYSVQDSKLRSLTNEPIVQRTYRSTKQPTSQPNKLL